MRSLAVVVCFLLVSIPAALAQGDRGTITGTISDPAGAVVANAPVEAKHLDTGSVYQAATSNTGNYTLSQLPAGIYEITVGVQGFKKYTRTGITVQVAQTLRIDVGLEVGATSENVTVTADAPLLKTESGELSHTVSIQRMDDLPVLGIGSQASSTYGLRNPLNVTELIPGTYFASNATTRVNGALANTQSIRIEGQDATDTMFTASTVMTQPSVDAIQEVTIQTSNFSAEYGQVGGGYFNFTMKSGGNQFHGSAYDYFVNEAFNASQPYTNQKDIQRRNDYGFTLGGPVWLGKFYNGHDKTFFFFNWEQFRQNQILQTTAQTVPIPAFLTGNFSSILTSKTNLALDPLQRPIAENSIYDPATERTLNGQVIRDPFAGNIIPATRFDPVAVKVQSLIPQPQGPSANGLTSNYLNPIRGPRITSIPAVKADHNLNAKAKVSFYYSRTTTWNQYSQGNGAADGLPLPITAAIGNFIHSDTTRLNFDESLTPTLLLHLGAGYQDHHFNEDSPTLNYNSLQQLGLKGQTAVRNFPFFSGLSNAFGGMTNMGPGAQVDDYSQKPTFNTSLTWVKSNHTYKIGGEFRIEGYPTFTYSTANGRYAFSAAETGLPYRQSSTISGSTIGFPYASFLLGMVDSGSGGVVTDARLGKSQLGLFVQDTWKVTRKLTVDYGLRWDYSTYQKEQYGRYPSFSETVSNPATGGIPGGIIFEGGGPGHCNCDFAHNYPYAIGPRLGAAYQINPKTVLRAGWGIVYSGTPANNFTATSSSVPFNSSSFGEPSATLQTGLPLTPAQLAWPNFNAGYLNLPGSTPGATLVDPNAGRPARQIQWSVGIQREIARNLALEVAYVANRGYWWPAGGLVNYNALTPQILAAHGLNLNNAADLTLLTSTISSPAVVARGFGLPFPGFSPTATLAQALRPFPQFGTIGALWAPLGKTWYDSLQVKATKRFSHGLDFTSVFTWQKNLYMGAEADGAGAGGAPALVNDVFNRNTNKFISGFDQPLTSITALNYTLPKWGPNKALRYAVGDWQIGAVLQYASGLPIAVPTAQSNLTSYLFRGTFANRVPGQALFTTDINCHCYDPSRTLVLNPAAWTDPAKGQFGSSAAYYEDYRGPRRPQENASLARNFKIKERANFMLRIEFSNILNHPYFAFPSGANASATSTRNASGQYTAGFGYINVFSPIAATFAGPGPRGGTLVGRFTF
jgi:hypothetical protein